MCSSQKPGGSVRAFQYKCNYSTALSIILTSQDKQKDIWTLDYYLIAAKVFSVGLGGPFNDIMLMCFCC